MGIHTTTEHAASISLPPGTILGYRADGRPIHVMAGGAEDDPEPEIEVPEDPEPEPADDPEPKPEDAPKPKPPGGRLQAAVP